ncbi:hypothetical protein ACH4U5_27550 [Streptomyces sp. NPDC020858]|uniref:hypothetical protein n=1 Tax=Streptomyces sp. NPDC020858 TaxID=3365097 RepID=UPI0037AFD690
MHCANRARIGDEGDPAVADDQPVTVRSDVALAIEHPGVVRYLAGIFDHAWQRASPLRDVRPAGPGGGLPAPLADDVRCTILRHMVNGHTDEAIAAPVDRLERAIEEKRNALQAVRSSISRAQEVYLDSYARTDAHPVRALYGAGTIAAALSAAVHACRDDLLTAQPGGGRPQDLSSSGGCPTAASFPFRPGSRPVRLGLSTRSVANHMRWAAELFGSRSRSRAQLAYLIARSDFLEDAQPTQP